MDLRNYVIISVLVFKDIDIRLPVVSELKVDLIFTFKIWKIALVSLIYRLLQTVTLSLGRAACVIDIIELLFLTPGILTLLFQIYLRFYRWKWLEAESKRPIYRSSDL